jgi:hypothetical protein
MSRILGLDPLDQERYKADLELLDRYVQFSAELVRLSLLGIAGLIVYLPQTAVAPAEWTLRSAWYNVLLGSAILVFLESAPPAASSTAIMQLTAWRITSEQCDWLSVTHRHRR